MRVLNKKEFQTLEANKALQLNTYKRREMKFSILDKLKELNLFNWKRSKKLVSVLDEIVFKATDKGYSFTGRKTLAEKYKCTTRTVDRAFRILKDSKMFVICYRENPDSNSAKTPVVFPKDHPHFKHFSKLLNFEVDFEEEKRSISSQSRDQKPKKVSTYSLPSLKNLKDLSLDKSYLPSFVDKSFVDEVWKYYRDASKVFGLWNIVMLVGKKLGFSKYRLLDMSEDIIQALKNTFFALKHNRIKKSFESYFYGVLYRKLSLNQTQMDVYRLKDELPY